MSKIVISGQEIEFGLKGAPGSDGNPIGAVISYTGTTAPDGYLVCDGKTYPINDYPQLANFFESQYGEKSHFGGDGTTDFAVPTLTESGVLRCIKAYDSAGAYSLEETRIGTWIDGRPIYRILLYGNSGQANVWSYFSEIENLNEVICSYGYLDEKGTSGDSFIFLPGNLVSVGVNSDKRRIGIYNSNGAFAWKDIMLIVEYTKTTDEATIDISDAVASARAKAGFDSQFSYEQSTDGIYASYASDVLPREKQKYEVNKEESI